MIENIKFIFERTLRQNEWMDYSTREAALKKVAIDFQIFVIIQSSVSWNMLNMCGNSQT